MEMGEEWTFFLVVEEERGSNEKEKKMNNIQLFILIRWICQEIDARPKIANLLLQPGDNRRTQIKIDGVKSGSVESWPV